VRGVLNKQRRWLSLVKRSTRTRRSAPDWASLTGAEAMLAVRDARDSVPLPSNIGGMYEDGKIKSEYIDHRPAEAALSKLHKKSRRLIPEEVELTPGLIQAMKKGIEWNQIAYREPWAVMWVRVRDGKRVKGRKNFTSLGAAIAFWGTVKPTIPTATVVSLRRSYDIPSELRGRLPKSWAWCPRCMVPRKFQRDEDERWFYAFKKVKTSKGGYEFKERKVVYLLCPMCGCSNRDPAWRRSNQPWERRRIKRGVHKLRKSQRGHKPPPKRRTRGRGRGV
jgi:hypothetical protein